ncbi:MAG: isoleucine--tRNA ligase [Phycisphaeraceae bacterium]
MTEPTQEKPSYKKTLNLPKTRFAMRANLVQREPQFQQRWDKLKLYDRLRDTEHPRGRFVLHDGPPYANGSIHLGHLLNKVLKDLVVRSRSMLGYDAPFIPGWDCHGLPIEHRVLKELGDKARTLTPRDIRKQCQKDAAKFVKLQTKQMQRLGTIGDYKNPYLTMDPAYEGATLEVFADLVERGIVYRDLKPVHWSIANRTALADAELEYADREDTSIYVQFEVANPQDLPAGLMARPGLPISLMIWTTTPWTIPANLAVAAAHAAIYGLYRYECDGKSGAAIVADELAEKVFSQVNASYDRIGECTGQQLADAHITYKHPFIERESPLVTATHVTLEDGTGLVHTAPGHGTEDYQVGLQHKLAIYCPVLADGTFDDTAPAWLQGKDVWEANSLVVEHLRESGHLFHDQPFMHSYPHDWRSKTPVIFRATEQWFIGVNQPFDGGGSLRDRALAETADDVTFIPEWGKNRMRGMLESRPDWCISRQRAWGLPIPAFFGPEKGQVLLTPASVRAVSQVVRKRGSDAWFFADAADLLADYDPATDPDAPDWVKTAINDQQSAITKGTDIFDVWFDSGSSWHAVARQRGLGFPVDMYLEGSDQHRGWFQLSLLPAIGVTGKAPFKTVLTHGFMVDKNGHKMSKSVGNTIEVEDLMKDLGADVCRWWVASLNTDNDIKADIDIFRHAGEEYRKVRNTIRFLLSNLQDFDVKTDRRELTADDANTIDAWMAGELAKLIENVHLGYETYRFRRVHEAVFHFCNETLSAVYLAATKDRLYCDRPDSDRRRRTQTLLFDTADALIRAIAPILVHTADEAFLALHGQEMNADTCIHLEHLPEPREATLSGAWPEVMALRDRALKTLEQARAAHNIDNPLDAGISVTTTDALAERMQPFLHDLADLCGVSRFNLTSGAEAENITIDDLRDQPRCERSWKRDGTVKPRSDGGMLTDRDAEAVGVS